MRVLILVDNNLRIDGRTRKQARTLAAEGYDVHIIGVGTEIPKEILSEPYTLHLARPLYKGKKIAPRLGRKDVPLPIRWLVNKTVTRFKERGYEREFNKNQKYSNHVRRPEMIAVGLTLNPDIVQCQDLDTLYAGYRIAQQCNAALAYDSHELFLDLHFLEDDHREEYAEIERELFPKLDGFMTVAPEIADILIKQYDSPLEPVIIYNAGATVASSTKPVVGKPKLLFQGAFVPDRNNLELIRAMVHLKGKATLTLQGWGADEVPMGQLISELGLEETVTIIPPCDPLKVVESASNFDIGLMNYKLLDRSLVYALPNKLFDYMCAGLAVVSTNAPLIKGIVDSSQCGITFEQNGFEHTAEVLLNLISDPQRISGYKSNSLKAAPQYSWSAQEPKLLALYAELGKIAQKKRIRGRANKN